VIADERLALLGQNADDLPAISALVQDATLRTLDIAYDRRGRRLVLLINRFRHESTIPSRVRSALRLETVEAVQRQHWPAGETVLALLSLTHNDGWLVLSFAGGTTIRARPEVIEVVLEDLSAPWPTSREPRHD
jgi:Protein of unknown function (DUF2948)